MKYDEGDLASLSRDDVMFNYIDHVLPTNNTGIVDRGEE